MLLVQAEVRSILKNIIVFLFVVFATVGILLLGCSAFSMDTNEKREESSAVGDRRISPSCAVLLSHTQVSSVQ